MSTLWNVNLTTPTREKKMSIPKSTKSEELSYDSEYPDNNMIRKETKENTHTNLFSYTDDSSNQIKTGPKEQKISLSNIKTSL